MSQQITQSRKQVSGFSLYLDAQTDEFKAQEAGEAASNILISAFLDMLPRSQVGFSRDAFISFDFSKCQTFFFPQQKFSKVSLGQISDIFDLALTSRIKMIISQGSI